MGRYDFEMFNDSYLESKAYGYGLKITQEKEPGLNFVTFKNIDNINTDDYVHLIYKGKNQTKGIPKIEILFKNPMNKIQELICLLDYLKHFKELALQYDKVL